ncbi:hypothetical protein ABZ368_09155 [Streptomyces sp. NPDC005908]|uniref:hypothetical protein n=1 Tax=Streptomyces sp. NPDC005908 TaxID=3157084 RepID=UPI0033CDFF5F
MKPHQGRLRRRLQMAGGLLRRVVRRPVVGWTVILVVLSVLARHHPSQTWVALISGLILPAWLIPISAGYERSRADGEGGAR